MSTNRNELYTYLKGLGMYPMMVRRDKKSYSTEFRLNQEIGQYDSKITLDWGYISHVSTIHLYAKEVHIEDKFGHMSININYKDIEKFEVEIYEENEKMNLYE